MTLHYRILGEGKPLLILHGLFGSSDNWQTFAKQISEKGYSVILADLRNHGRSPHADEFDFVVLSNDVFETLEQAGFKECCVLGHSLGGKTAMFLALNHPQCVTKLIVIDIAPKKYPVLHSKIMEGLTAVNVSSLASRKEAEEKLSHFVTNESEKQFLLKNLYRTEENTFAWRFNLGSICSNIEKAGEAVPEDNIFSKPVLFIRGEKSNYISEEDFNEARKTFPEAKLLTAPGSGHWVHADNPGWLADILLNFLT
jgi:pimeloyl-ACP methyl ester carboxylesterase